MLRNVQVIKGGEIGQSFDCKTTGCTGETNQSRGPYAFLCDTCVDELQRKRRITQLNGAARNELELDELESLDESKEPEMVEPVPEPEVQSSAANGQPSHQARAIALAELGQELDAALEACEEARQRWDSAVAQLAEQVWPPM